MNQAFDNKKQADKSRRTKGAPKPKGKRFNKGPKAPAKPKAIVPVNLYTCECHGEIAAKKACARSDKDREEHKKGSSPLGTWHCPVTGKKCKVKRLKNTEGEKVTPA